MRFLWILLPLLACNTLSFEFSGVPAQQVIVGKSVFDLRMVGAGLKRSALIANGHQI